MKKKLENKELQKAVGKSTLLRIDWKSFDDELPPTSVPIWVIIKLDHGFYPVSATYFDETMRATKLFPKSRWQRIKFDAYNLPDVFIGPNKDRNSKRLIAWGRSKSVIFLGTECSICKRLDCICAELEKE